MANKRAAWYVGTVSISEYGIVKQAFKSFDVPTPETHRHLYLYVNGPFRTKRGAMWASAHPYCWYDSIGRLESHAKMASLGFPDFMH